MRYRTLVGHVGAAAAALGLLMTPLTAHAAEGAIEHVEVSDGRLQILFSTPVGTAGAAPDLDSVTVTVEGVDAAATAALAANSVERIDRTAVLAIDVSQSMAGDKFTAAKAAAKEFLRAAPADVQVGLISFAGDVEVIAEPTTDRASTSNAIDGLALSLQTHLYDGVLEAVDAAGDEGLRSVLVLSDGADTSKTELDQVTAAIAEAEVKVDVVALAQSATNKEKLTAIAAAGDGSVLDANDPASLSAVFAGEAEALARQVLITADMPADVTATEGTVAVSLQVGDGNLSDSAFTSFADATATEATTELPSVSQGSGISRPIMLTGLVGAAAGFLVLLLLALGVISVGKGDGVENRISAYGRQTQGGARRATPSSSFSPSVEGVRGSATALAGKALSGNQHLEASLAGRLDTAGISMKPAEWVPLHAAIGFVAALAGVLLGSFPMALLLLALGLVGPWMYLSLKRSRRIKAFNGQLAETLQLMSGSLSAGLSFAQSIDTVVREGSEPITTEFKRALMESRLGVQIEDALESVADRMESEDFKWVVLAVKIQREVGGNLAEVLNQVAATIREREYLRRQVKSLSAEGVLSAWILGAMPIAMFGYFLMVRPEYMQPMFEEPMGWAMLGGGVLMMIAGAFWLSRLVKLEV